MRHRDDAPLARVVVREVVEFHAIVERLARRRVAQSVNRHVREHRARIGENAERRRVTGVGRHAEHRARRPSLVRGIVVVEHPVLDPRQRAREVRVNDARRLALDHQWCRPLAGALDRIVEVTSPARRPVEVGASVGVDREASEPRRRDDSVLDQPSGYIEDRNDAALLERRRLHRAIGVGEVDHEVYVGAVEQREVARVAHALDHVAAVGQRVLRAHELDAGVGVLREEPLRERRDFGDVPRRVAAGFIARNVAGLDPLRRADGGETEVLRETPRERRLADLRVTDDEHVRSHGDSQQGLTAGLNSLFAASHSAMIAKTT